MQYKHKKGEFIQCFVMHYLQCSNTCYMQYPYKLSAHLSVACNQKMVWLFQLCGNFIHHTGISTLNTCHSCAIQIFCGKQIFCAKLHLESCQMLSTVAYVFIVQKMQPQTSHTQTQQQLVYIYKCCCLESYNKPATSAQKYTRIQLP